MKTVLPDLTDIRDAHGRHNCKDLNGEEPWACSDCDCTQKLEAKLEKEGTRFFDELKQEVYAAVQFHRDT